MFGLVEFRRPLSMIVALWLAALLWRVGPLSADSFDWRNVASQNWNTPAKQQFGGTCWAHGPTGAVEAKYMLTRNDLSYNPNLSEQQLVWETSPDLGNTIGGAGFDLMLNYYRDHGVVSDAECPKETNSAYWDAPAASDPWPLASGWQNRCWKIAGWTPFTTTNLKSTIKADGPVIVGYNADDSYESVADLKAHYASHVNTDNHAVSIVGYCDDATCPTGGYWIIKNSWGTGWGESGFGYIPYTSSVEGLNHLYSLSSPAYYTGAMATVTWKGGSANWSSGGSNWSGTDQYGHALPSYAWENKETSATFNAPGAGVNLSGRVIAHGLTISSGATGYVFNGINSGALTVTGGGINASEDVVINTPVTVGAPQAWTVASGKWLTIGSDVHTIISTLTVNGPGMTVIDGSIDGGGTINATGAAPGNIAITGGAWLYLRGNGGTSYLVDANVGSGGLAFQPPTGTSSNYYGIISGNGGVVKWGGGTAILTNNNRHTGTTTICDGALQADNSDGLPANSFLDLNGGVLQSNSVAVFTRSLGTSGGAFQWNTGGGGFSAGDNPMTVKIGNGTATVNWGTAVGSGIVGTLKFGSSTANNVTTFQNGINLNGTSRTISVEKNLNSANDLAVVSGNVVDSSGTNHGGLVKTGPGTLKLTGTNAYGDNTGHFGLTEIQAGALQADRGAGLPAASGLILNGGVLQSNSTITYSDPFWYGAPNGSCLTWDHGGFSAGGGKMTVNLYGDGRTISWGTDLRNSILGTMILGSNTAQYETEIKNALNLAGGSRTVEVDENPYATGDFATLSGVIGDSAGGGSVTKTGPGKLVISGVSGNTYTGNTQVVAGTLALAKTSGPAVPGNLYLSAPNDSTFTLLQGNNQFGVSSVINFGGGIWPSFELLGHTATVAGISDAYGTGIIENTEAERGFYADGTLAVNNSSNFTFTGYLRDGGSSGSISRLALVKSGLGKLTLSGAHCGGYTGGLTVNGGTLDCSGGALPACDYTIAGGALNIGSLSQTIGTFQLNGGAVVGSGTLTSDSTYDIRAGTVAAGLAGTSIGLTKSGSGTALLAGANTYTGRTTITAGALELATVVARHPVLDLGGADIQNDATRLLFEYAGASDNPATQIAAILTASYGHGIHPFSVGNGAKIFSSTAEAAGRALGWADNGSSEVIVMYTVYGDADLDGAVGVADLNKVLTNYNRTGAIWSGGDFDYNGIVDLTDLNKVLTNYNKSGGSAVKPVPEPAGFALLLAGAACALACAWRRVRD